MLIFIGVQYPLKNVKCNNIHLFSFENVFLFFKIAIYFELNILEFQLGSKWETTKTWQC